ncbi:hypothetical protein PWK40_004431 [Citrobacter koseri]|uniref:hypothetical protein n=1 Tax=Gammaproteobacteria TaxID=1236 RepID=UPI000486527C|nr:MULTISPECIES: hypothetical protein [Gammaproteobacteria]EKV5614132.1 hypothetical protein [Citrobacter koseri]QSD89651.1 hypothetical protein JMM80_26220 [Serratia marcescens]ELP5236216.1 hypothetical protein [Citrobacter freundii]MCD2461851.1 hypothetical protein [Enterobacter cloacae complex sp. 2021EL-01261]MCG3895433.1 hypothetical protein [Escherichia coli]
MALDFAYAMQILRNEPLPTPKNPNRHPADVLRVQYWFHGVSKALNCRAAYQLEKLFEPEHFRRQNQRTSYPNKWGRYAAGDNTPQLKLLQMVEARAPGTQRELQHPLWHFLKRQGSTRPLTSNDMSKLDPNVQMIVFKPLHNAHFGAPRSWVPFSRQVANKLLRHGDLDALAALVVYWGIAKSQGSAKEIEYVAATIYRMLLVVGVFFYHRKLHAELLMLFTTVIFDHTPWAVGRFGIDTATFYFSILVLHSPFDPNREVMSTQAWNEKIIKINGLLSGKMGFDMKFALEPFCLPTWELGPPTRQNWTVWEQQRRYWAWGWHCLLHQIIGKFPPMEVAVDYPGPKDNYPCQGEEWLLIKDRFPRNLNPTAVIFEYGQWPPTEFISERFLS